MFSRPSNCHMSDLYARGVSTDLTTLKPAFSNRDFAVRVSKNRNGFLSMFLRALSGTTERSAISDRFSTHPGYSSPAFTLASYVGINEANPLTYGDNITA